MWSSRSDGTKSEYRCTWLVPLQNGGPVWINSELVADPQMLQTVSAKVRGVRASISFYVDGTEHQFRQMRGVGAFSTVKQLLAAVQEEKPDSSAPRGLLWLSGFPEDLDWDVPSFAPPVKVRGVRVAAGSWRTGLSSASRFAGYAERTVALGSKPRDPSFAALEATYYGVGLVIGEGAGEATLAAPAPFKPERFSLASWLFAEQVYREWLSTLSPTSPRG